MATSKNSLTFYQKIEPEVTSQGGNQGNKHSSPSLLSSVLTWPKSKWIQRHGRPTDIATQVSFMGQRAPRERKISIFGGANKFVHNDFYLILIGCLFLVDLQDINFLSSPSLWLTLLFSFWFLLIRGKIRFLYH